MATDTRERGGPGTRADYLRGDPAEDGPITRGRLELEARGLRFSVPGGPELLIGLDEIEALTVSGRSPYERPRRSVRGTMLVAARRNGSVDVWEFAVERTAGARLRDRINRELHARGLRRPPLPFVEQLVGPMPPIDAESAAQDLNGHTDTNGNARAHRAAPEWRFGLLRPRVAVLVLAGSAVVLAEILVVLAILR